MCCSSVGHQCGLLCVQWLVSETMFYCDVLVDVWASYVGHCGVVVGDWLVLIPMWDTIV